LLISRWCVSAISTRQNQIINEEKQPMLALIPILDMCNHDEDGRFCTDFDDERKCAKCYALRDLNENDEIKIFYGNRNNCDLLIHNGFVIENNQFNTFKLKLGISLHDKLFKERTLALEKYGISK
jgi:hypothetical protein